MRRVSFGLVALLLLAALTFLAIRDRPNGPPTHVFLVVYDTLRADHLGAWGYAPSVSPHIDALAQESAVFDSAISLSSWTRPSVTTLLTSLSPVDHRVGYQESVLPEGTPVLAQVLRDAGFETLGWSANINVGAAAGLDRGFDRFAVVGDENARVSSSGTILEQAIDFIDPDRPQFFFLQLIGPHGPYVPSEASRDALGIGFDPVIENRMAHEFPKVWYRADDSEQVDYLRSLYDAEILDEDVFIARLLDALEERGLTEHALVVFTSDHGEAFGEHGEMEHGGSLFHEEIHVPLLFRGPGIAPDRYDALVGLHDVAPTILGQLAIAAPSSFSGVDLFDSIPPDRVIRLREFGESGDDLELLGVIRNGRKAIWSPADEGVRFLFDDWRRDGFALDRADDDGAAFERLRDLGGIDPERVRPIEMSEPSERTQRALRALGYLD